MNQVLAQVGSGAEVVNGLAYAGAVFVGITLIAMIFPRMITATERKIIK